MGEERKRGDKWEGKRSDEWEKKERKVINERRKKER
jgi:hypothetical protein